MAISALNNRAEENTNFAGFGPIYDKFPLTLAPGERSEALGPFFGWQRSGPASMFNFTPVFSLYTDKTIPQTEFELAYPILSFDKFGKEYRFQLFQVIAWSGGESMKAKGDKKRTTIFPFYFKQSGPLPEDNYWALLPFYGTLRNRLFRDEVKFVMLPLYLQSTKKKVVTDNYVFPLFHLRHGPGLKGWQFWPLVGNERKELTTSTNNWGETVVEGGHEKFFALWPFYFNNTLGIGTTNVQKQFVLIPFYSNQTASNRVSKSYGFPLGYTHTIDYEKKYEEKDMPWPFIVFAHGEGKQTKRVWPFFSRASTPILRSDFYMWPVYKYNAVNADPLQRERTRILLFLYSDLLERNTTNNTALHRRDFWPLFTWRRDHQNNERLQILSILEPLLPGNKSIERVYSPLWSIWRDERNGKTGARSQSLLWNLYRSDKKENYNKKSALFGLFQREKKAGETRWRIFFIPFTTGEKDAIQTPGNEGKAGG